MMSFRPFVALLLAGTATLMSSLSEASPTEAPIGGETAVWLAPGFLSALDQLGVAPASLGSARLYPGQGGVFAAFPITTGAVDLGDTESEIDHAGGLSLKAGSTIVALTGFIIQANPKGVSTLTGIVSVNGSLVGRIPLFDLSLAKAKVWESNGFLDIGNVAVTLDERAAAALGSAFHTAIPTIAVGTAEIKAVLSTAL